VESSRLAYSVAPNGKHNTSKHLPHVITRVVLVIISVSLMENIVSLKLS
jgi:hypothetical protein